MARRDEGFFSARDNTKLYWQSLMPEQTPTAFVGVVHGYADHSGRYRRVIEHLVSQGFGVLALDYRGHGKAEGKRGDVIEWSRFVDDLEVFWARLRGMAQGAPTFLLAHSHGGLMALHWVLRRPEGLKGLVLSAPYLKLAMQPPKLKVLGARAVGTLLPSLGIASGLTVEQLSRDTAWQKETSEDPLYFKTATPRWFVQSTKAQAELEGQGRNVHVPLLWVVGSDDPIASTPASRAYFETVASNDKTLIEEPGMRHEVLCEVGKEALWEKISRWISAHR